MLIQIHHQFPDGTTDVCVQAKFTTHDDLRVLLDRTKETHPLPNGAKWLCVTESSDRFVMMEDKG